jgi:hypothetical protein
VFDVGGCGKIHTEVLHYFTLLPGIVRVVKLRKMGWAGHVTGVREKRNVYRVLEKPCMKDSIWKT